MKRTRNESDELHETSIGPPRVKRFGHVPPPLPTAEPAAGVRVLDEPRVKDEWTYRDTLIGDEIPEPRGEA